MVLANFQFKDKFGKACFFQGIFLLATNSVDVILEMFFLSFSNANILFAERELI